ncbi:MAG: hypothetical protein ACRDSJ_17565 [Rubrobacteraceae bacterium]
MSVEMKPIGFVIKGRFQHPLAHEAEPRNSTSPRVRDIDMKHGTPILDIKPWPGDRRGSPAYGG